MLPLCRRGAVPRPGVARVRVLPRFFAPLTAPAPAGYRRPPDLDPESHVRRAPLENQFTTLPWPKKYVDEVPFRTSRALLLRLLGDTLRRAIVGAAWHPRPGRDSIRTLRGLPVDSLYRRMLRVSDNFLAEQLLLLCSTRVGLHDSLSGARVIRKLLKTSLKALPDPPVWVDGSGLSRLNLLTPRDLTAPAAPAAPASGGEAPVESCWRRAAAKAPCTCATLRPARPKPPGFGAKPAPSPIPATSRATCAAKAAACWPLRSSTTTLWATTKPRATKWNGCCGRCGRGGEAKFRRAAAVL